MAIEIVDFPMKNGGSFHSSVSLPEGKFSPIKNPQKSSGSWPIAQCIEKAFYDGTLRNGHSSNEEVTKVAGFTGAPFPTEGRTSFFHLSQGTSSP